MVVVAEVWMSTEDLPLASKTGWRIVATLSPAATRGTTYGGMLIYIKNKIPVNILANTPVGWQAIVWLRFGDVVAAFAYLPPEDSPLLEHWPLDPMETLLSQQQSYAAKFPGKPIVIIGDLNARRAHPPDRKWSPRGRYLQLMLPPEWQIHAPAFTHFSARHQNFTTIDYFLLSPEASLRSPSMQVDAITESSDHAVLHLTIGCHFQKEDAIPPLPNKRPPKPSGRPSALDKEERAFNALLPKPLPSDRVLFPKFAVDTTLVNTLRKTVTGIAGEIRLAQHSIPDELKLRSRVARNLLTSARRRNRHQIRSKRIAFLTKLPHGLWWKYVNSIRQNRDAGSIQVPGPELTEHFQNLLYDETANDIPAYVGPDTPITAFEDDFTEEEVTACLAKMRASTSGEDGITLSQLKGIPTETLTNYMNLILREQSVPASWKRSVLVAIPKSNQPTDQAANVRGIALQPRMRKLFTLLLTVRMQEYVEPILPPTQNGFRPKRRTGDNTFIVRTLHEQAVEENSPLYVAQIDIKKAFDSVSRATLFQRLYDLGIHGRLIEVLRQSYMGQDVFVRSNRRYSNAIPVNRGVLQGDPISPLLFIIYMITIELDHPDDPKLGELPIAYVALADDYTLFSTTHSGLQWKLNELVRLCEAIGLRINPSKCAILGLGNLPTIPYL